MTFSSVWLSLSSCSRSEISNWVVFLTCNFKAFRHTVMIWSIPSFRVTNSSLYSDSWNTWNLKSILDDFGMRSWYLLNPLSSFVFYQMQWWCVTCFVPRMFNRSDKLSWSNTVWSFIKASVGDLGYCLLLVDSCETDGLKCVRLLKFLVPVTVFVVFKISLYLCSYPLSPYSFRCRQAQIEEITVSVDVY